MPATPLKIGFGTYDRTTPLSNGTVTIPNIAATYTTSPLITTIFAGMIRDRAFDVAELGLSYFLRTMDEPSRLFLALPIFPNRVFRHSAIYINKHKGIKGPADLRGKRVGEFAIDGHDAGVWPKGVLQEEFGVGPEECEWVVGGLDWPLGDDLSWVPRRWPAGVRVVQRTGEDLGAMLERGEIDALISADVPKCVLEGSPDVGRLWEDYVEVEREYYGRTGIFPIMHLVVVRRELAEDRELMRSVYEGFCEAKGVVQGELRKGLIFNNMPVMVPWFSKLLEEDKNLMGGGLVAVWDGGES